jgi:ATP-dependent DNA helicase RecQ
LPSQVCFSAPKELLLDFGQTHPQLEPVMKCLLRAYEGIYDNKVSVNEKQLSRLTGKTTEQVKRELRQLNALGIIEYDAQKETPQIYFLTNRAPAQYLEINIKRYRQRKKEFAHRVETMHRYLQTENICRSRLIGNYFGDEEMVNCGICDNCLKRKTIPLAEKEFVSIKQRILNTLVHDKVIVQDVLHACSGIKKEKLWKVLEYLQGEKIIRIESDGRVKLLKFNS